MPLGTIQIESGLIEGIPCGNPAYTVFKGIPYAKPPVGDLRWRSPVDPEPWAGVRICDSFAAASIQPKQTPGQFYQIEFFPVDYTMSEDCLYLNVWTPASSTDEKLPVMMWIHGGAFIGGFGHEMEFDGEAFCRRGVILVTINYRLGNLGFLAHPQLSGRSPNGVSGNYGLLDMIQALNWINKNIATFGGDPGNVTVFGQSAGGGAVLALSCSPLTKNLVHKAIVQSGGSISNIGGRFTHEDAEKAGIEICAKSGKSIDELLAMPAEELLALVESALTLPGARYPQMKMMPNVDGYVLPDVPGTMLAYGRHHDIPYMTGSVSGDGNFFRGAQIQSIDEFKNHLQKVYGNKAEEFLKLLELDTENELSNATDLISSASAKLAPRCWAEAHLKQKRKPAYIYYFDRNMPGDDHPGAFHSAELWYIFGTISRCWRPMEAVDYGISTVMSDYWTNFAKNGHPNGNGQTEWPPFSEENPVALVIDDTRIAAVDMGGDPILKGMEDLAFEKVYLSN